MNIGERIKEELAQQGRTVRWLAAQIPCERSNVYKIFMRPDIDTELLKRICVILEHDFFKELSDETFGNEPNGGDDMK